MTHTSDIRLFWELVIVSLLTSCASVSPAMIDGQVVAMGTGAAIEVFKAAVLGTGGAQMFVMQVPGGFGYMAIQPFEHWFGVVLYSTSTKCPGQCLCEMLKLTGNAMTPRTMKDLLEFAQNLGFYRIMPAALPAWMRMAVSAAHGAWSATQLASAWVVIVPVGVFGMPPEVEAEAVEN